MLTNRLPGSIRQELIQLKLCWLQWWMAEAMATKMRFYLLKREKCCKAESWFFFFEFLTMQVGTMSTGEKDDAGRPMGTIIASSRGMICRWCWCLLNPFQRQTLFDTQWTTVTSVGFVEQLFVRNDILWWWSSSEGALHLVPRLSHHQLSAGQQGSYQVSGIQSLVKS